MDSKLASLDITLRQGYLGLDANEAGNYRAVSNLSVLSKTLEKAVSQQLERHLPSSGLFPSHQSAYRKGHSTESLLLRVTSDLISHLDQPTRAKWHLRHS